jgi:hypothetical protein
MSMSRQPDAATADSDHVWRVCRQDDNGNRFTIRTGLTESEARSLVASFESLGHKQLYWAEAEPQGLSADGPPP